MEVPGMFSQEVLIAFGLTLFAGLSTGIGSALAFFTKTTNTRFLSVALGFSAGVMIYVAMVEIYFHALEALVGGLGEVRGHWITFISFFGGIIFIAVIDRLVPMAHNPHEVRTLEDVRDEVREAEFLEEQRPSGSFKAAGVPVEAVAKKPEVHEQVKKKKLMRMGLFTALAIAIHNFPEGLATFIAALTDLSIGVPIAIAIAIHNIPEGIAISIPVYYATGSRRKAFLFSFLSGLAEPLGALIGWLILMPYLTDTLFGIIFAGVAGIMVFISLDELLPSAREYGEHHLSIYGLIGGMAVMGISLILLM